MGGGWNLFCAQVTTPSGVSNVAKLISLGEKKAVHCRGGGCAGQGRGGGFSLRAEFHSCMQNKKFLPSNTFHLSKSLEVLRKMEMCLSKEIPY